MAMIYRRRRAISRPTHIIATDDDDKANGHDTPPANISLPANIASTADFT